MKAKSGIISVFLSAVLFTVLFYKQALGLNLLIFELLYLTWLLLARQLSFRKNTQNMNTALAGMLATAVFSVFTYSVFVYIMNFLALLVFVGMLIYPEAKSFISAIKLSLQNILGSQMRFLTRLSGSRLNRQQTGGVMRSLLIFGVPIVIIVIFISLYSSSNPIFDRLVVRLTTGIADGFEFLFKNIDFLIAGNFLLGLLLSNYLIIRSLNQRIVDKDAESSNELSRIKSTGFRSFNSISLRNEYKAGVFLLVSLNALILIVNLIDIYWVWFNVTWNGQYLKQFVHQGTYMLILSILISIALVLYFFRRNINFYSKNSFLKYLSYAWLAQNAILAISVGVRNYWYIYYYALAYKRIGVIIFLLLTLYGLYSVFIKVRERRTAFYLFRVNTYAWFVVLVIASLINWDTLIARYNFSHAERSFLHFNFVARLSDNALPYLDKPLKELYRIDSIKNKNFPNEVVRYMNPDQYYAVIERRKESFRVKWEAKSFLSWNYPEYKAYHKLFGK
jgi:hypothetical protein